MNPRTLILDGERPFTVNTERRWTRWQRAAKVAEWRQHARCVALAEHIPHYDTVTVTAWPLVRDRRGWQDVGGCYPTVKAVIDGLVDAHVLDGDGPDVVRAITLTAPVVGDLDGLAITLSEEISR